MLGKESWLLFYISVPGLDNSITLPQYRHIVGRNCLSMSAPHYSSCCYVRIESPDTGICPEGHGFSSGLPEAVLITPNSAMAYLGDLAFWLTRDWGKGGG